jgi:hypothetical protein
MTKLLDIIWPMLDEKVINAIRSRARRYVRLGNGSDLAMQNTLADFIDEINKMENGTNSSDPRKYEQKTSTT